jgi:hypothetical protein
VRILLIVVLTAACAPGGGSALPHVDAQVAVADGAPCLGALELGHCVTDTGADCNGSVGEVENFAPLTDGAPMRMVQGPQGALMFVFSLRTTGVDPDGPLIAIDLSDETGASMARFKARVVLGGDDGGMESARGLYVVVEGTADGVAGHPLTAIGTLRDNAGVTRCGSAHIVAAR